MRQTAEWIFVPGRNQQECRPEGKLTQGSAGMSVVTRTIGLILLAAYPAGLSAQVVSNSSLTAPDHEVTPAAYQQLAALPEKVNVAAQPQPTPATTEPSPPANTSSLLPLSAPRTSASRADSDKQAGGFRSFINVGGSLAVVLGIFFLVVWLLRRASPRGLGILPAEAFEVLGRAPLAHHQQVHLLRCGNKLLLVSVTATGAETLTEISDPAEVERLAGVCRQTRPAGRAATFRQAFRQAENRHV